MRNLKFLAVRRPGSSPGEATMINPKHRKKDSNNSSSRALDFTFRGNRHIISIWDKLLPNAKQKLIDAGLFTEDGKITKAGLSALKDMEL